MPIFRSEYGIGRGEIAESRIEVPFFLLLMALSAVGLLFLHVYLRDPNITLAVGVSMLVFSLTVLRVELGVYFLVVAMLLSPEIAAGDVGKGQRQLNLRYDDILIMVIFLGVMLKQAFEGNGQLWLRTPINRGIVGYYSICLISTALALHRGLPLFDWKQAFFVLLKMLEYYLVFVLVGNAIRDMRHVRAALILFFVVALIIAGFGIVQIGVADRVSAPFEKGGTEPNTLGGYLMLVMCVALGLCLYAPRYRLMYLLVVGVSFIPFLYTLSRASYISLFAALVTLAVLGRSWVIAATLAAVLVASPFIMPSDVQDRVAYTFQEGSGKEVSVVGVGTGLEVDKSTHERLHVWSKVAFNLYLWPMLGGGVSWSTIQDSQYARVLIETGLIGMAAFLYLQWSILRSTRQATRWANDWLGRGLSLGICAGTVGLMMHSFGTNTFLIVRVMEPFWFLVALSMVVRQAAISEHTRAYCARQATDSENGTDLKPAAAA